jgi:hypothetical protein
MQAKSGGALATVLAIIAVFLVLGGLGLFWVAFRGVQMLKREASHAATVMTGDASVLVGKTDYVGTWTGGHETLTIDANGHVDWSKKEPGSSEEMHGSLGFDGSDLVIDVLVTKKRMHIDRPPHSVGSQMAMTLDGVELRR